MAVIKRKAGKKNVNAKKVMFDGIEFQSGLEKKMYQLLKEAGINFKYEEREILLIEKGKYPNDCYEKASKTNKVLVNKQNILKMGYTPDFAGDNEEWFIETKGRANESFPLRWKIFKKKMMERDNPPMLFKPTNETDCKQVIQILIDKGYGKKH